MNTLQRIIRPRFLWLTLSLATVATILLVACGGTSTPPATTQGTTPPPTTAPTIAAPPTSQPTTAAATQTVQVKIVEVNNQYQFQPATLTVPKGAEVVWTNSSDAPHTVTSDTNTFTSSSTFNQDQTFKTTFTTAGTFTYHCSIHTYMKATITVTS